MLHQGTDGAAWLHKGHYIFSGKLETIQSIRSAACVLSTRVILSSAYYILFYECRYNFGTVNYTNMLGFGRFLSGIRCIVSISSNQLVILRVHIIRFMM